MPSSRRGIAFTVNREPRLFAGAPFRRLIDVLREDFGLTGTKEGCGEGECGACTVLVDGAAVNSCLIPVCQVEGQSIRTVESLGRPESLNPLQQAFLDCGGAQCGICTPGMLMTATAWIDQGGSDDPDAIRRVLAGNLCRCTGYQHIVDAVIEAVRTGRTPIARGKAGAKDAAAKAGAAKQRAVKKGAVKKRRSNKVPSKEAAQKAAATTAVTRRGTAKGVVVSNRAVPNRAVPNRARATARKIR
jgi:aerobic-type carbon monoxide dehydrogenase small subunit (CoxS/CutS family)